MTDYIMIAAAILISIVLWIPIGSLRNSYYRQLREDLRAAEREPPKRCSRLFERLLNLVFPSRK